MYMKKLEFGDTIGIISPASPEKPEAIKNGIEFLKNLGFKIREGAHLYDRWGYLAGSDKERAQDLMDMFMDKDVDMLLCIRGGYGSMRILPLLDYEIIKNNPKIFMGFSDITALLNVFADRCGLVTFHGPMGSSNISDEETLKNFLFTIMKASPPYGIEAPPGIPLQSEVPGTAEGILAGGNMSLISCTLGTPYEINFKDKILFLEDVNEEPYAIDRILTQLLLAGKLQQCRGFILGQFKGCSLQHYERSLTLEEVFRDRIYSLNKPTVSNFQSGHSYPKLTLPIGAKAKIDCNITSIEITEGILK